MPVVDLSKVTEPVAVPTGEYIATLTGFKNVKTKANDDMVVLELTISEEDDAEEFHGKKVFQNCVLTEKSLFGLKTSLFALGADPDVLAEAFDTDEILPELVGNKCIVVREPSGNEQYPYNTKKLKPYEFE